jgi:nucleotide-binding universal stress UspA family protein
LEDARRRVIIMSSTIVVGVDGSEGSVRALKFALDEARLRACDVKAVAVWHIPLSVYEGSWFPATIDTAELEQVAREKLDESLADAQAAESGVSVTPVVREGQAADVLVDEARGADLLVVGSRGLGGFKGLLLGSVSQQCAHHASCPVAIVRDGDQLG